MIYDSLDHAAAYFSAVPGLDKAILAIQNFDKKSFSTGRIEVEKERLYLLANSYNPKQLSEESRMEAHRMFVDIMYVVSGSETVLVKPTTELCDVIQPYDKSADSLLARVDDDCTAVCLKPGRFAVFFPQDAHCPGIFRESVEVQKIICKLAI